MKQKQALKAYTTIIAMGKRVRGKAAFGLFRLKKDLKEVIDFQAEEEMKLIEKYGGTIMEGGIVTIEDEEKRLAFLKEKEELGEMDIDQEINPVTIGTDSITDINIWEIEALEGFVNFE